MDDLCTGCLCAGRNLKVLSNSEDYRTYEQILNEIPVYDTSGHTIRICWECRAALRNLLHFKRQVKDSYVQLMQCIATPSTPRLTIHHFCLEPDNLIKCEPLDHEPIQFDDHNTDVKEEPEECTNDAAFADELSACDEQDELLSEIKKKSKKKIKVKKTTKKSRVKVKKRKKVRQEEGPVETNHDLNEDVQVGERQKIRNLENEEITEIGLKQETEVNNIPLEIEYRPVTLSDGKPKCVECGKVFSSRKTYRYHVNVLHGGNNRHECPRCNKVYQWKSNLGRHMRTHKAVDAGELHCAVCDKTFASVATYRQHMKISRRHVSENDFTFVCNECGKKFVNKTRLRDHIDWDHLKKIKYKCHMCNKPFKCHTSLYLHTQNVHRDKEKKDNLCHVCGKSYQNAAKLKYHITAMHSGESPYRCAECGAAFGWYSSLYRHLRELHYKVKVETRKGKRSKKLPDLIELQTPIVPTVHYGPPLPN